MVPSCFRNRTLVSPTLPLTTNQRPQVPPTAFSQGPPAPQQQIDSAVQTVPTFHAPNSSPADNPEVEVVYAPTPTRKPTWADGNRSMYSTKEDRDEATKANHWGKSSQKEFDLLQQQSSSQMQPTQAQQVDLEFALPQAEGQSSLVHVGTQEQATFPQSEAYQESARDQRGNDQHGTLTSGSSPDIACQFPNQAGKQPTRQPLTMDEVQRVIQERGDPRYRDGFAVAVKMAHVRNAERQYPRAIARAGTLSDDLGQWEAVPDSGI